MNTVVEHLPLPGGARFAAPVRRSRVDIWAAPNPSELVLDPWAAPVGLPVARTRLSPWAAPSPATRVTWMAAPAVLLPPPIVTKPEHDAAVATERAIASLRNLASAPRTALVVAPTPIEATPVVQPTGELPPPEPHTAVTAASPSVRWRLVAMVSGAAAAVVAAVTLLVSVL